METNHHLRMWESKQKQAKTHTHTHLITCIHTHFPEKNFHANWGFSGGPVLSIFAPFFIHFDPFPSRLVTPTFLGGLFHPSTPVCNDRLEFPAEKLPSLTGVKSGQQGWMSMPWRMTSIRGINGGTKSKKSSFDFLPRQNRVFLLTDLCFRSCFATKAFALFS